MEPPSFACRLVAPFPSLAVSAASTPSRALFAPGRVSVVHFYNGG